jgi:hypothetical protein
MREPVRDRDRRYQDGQDDERCPGEQEPPPVAADERVVGVSGRPQRDRAEPDEDDAGTQGKEARVVVARGADLERVVDSLARADHDPEDPERERDRCPRPRTDAGVEPGEPQQDRERDETADEMIVYARPRLGLQEVVVEDVEGDQADRRPRDRELRPCDLPGTCGGGGGNGERGDSSTLRICVESHKRAGRLLAPPADAHSDRQQAEERGKPEGQR